MDLPLVRQEYIFERANHWGTTNQNLIEVRYMIARLLASWQSTKEKPLSALDVAPDLEKYFGSPNSGQPQEETLGDVRERKKKEREGK